VPIKKVKANKSNPRIIRDDKFRKLVRSIKEFPEMLRVRPIVVNGDMETLGGNMRLKACLEAGLKEVPVVVVEEWDEQRQKEFVIKDNLGYGEWDWDLLANEWDTQKLEEWGMDVWKGEEMMVEDEMEGEGGSGDLDDDKKRIYIEISQQFFEEMLDVLRYWREQDKEVGLMVFNYLRERKLENEKKS
jgi:hypothetical protein